VSDSSEAPCTVKEPFSVARIENLVRTISRAELKQKIDPKDNSPLVEILTTVPYHQQHGRSAINLPLERIIELPERY
jgi:hypothetical protein